jgi:hypothetical protein
MKKLLLILLLTSPCIGFSQNDNYVGKWSASGEGFENTMILEKIEGKNNSYKFSFFGWRNSYDTFTRQVIKFPGEMTNDIFIIEIKDNKSHYNDDILVLDEEFPIYNEGEERCNIYFKFNKETIEVKTKFCHLIYGGFGVFFDGIYEKTKP